MADTYIYVLIDPRTDEIRYVGKTVSKPEYRLNGHVYTARHKLKQGHAPMWVRSLLDAGVKPILRVLEIVPDGDDWAEREQYWIAEGRRVGWRLTNVTDGGEGTLGYNPPAEVRAKYSALSKGSKNVRALINENDARAIRYRYAEGGVTADTISAEYAVNPETIRAVLRGKTWRDAGGPIITTPNRRAKAKFTVEQVRALRENYKRGDCDIDSIARLHGVSVGAIYKLLSGRTYRDAGMPAYERRPDDKGSNNGRAKLTETDVVQIRIRHVEQAESCPKLAQEFGVSLAMIAMIVTGEMWQEVGGPTRERRRRGNIPTGKNKVNDTGKRK